MAKEFSILSKYFMEWCSDKVQVLSTLTEMEFKEDEHLDLLYVIVSLKFFDQSVFEKDRDVWHRELLISNLFQELDPCSDTDKLTFYNILLQIESTRINSKALRFYFTSTTTLVCLSR